MALVGIVEEVGNDEEITDETHRVDVYDEGENEEYDDQSSSRCSSYSSFTPVLEATWVLM